MLYVLAKWSYSGEKKKKENVYCGLIKCTLLTDILYWKGGGLHLDQPVLSASSSELLPKHPFPRLKILSHQHFTCEAAPSPTSPIFLMATKIFILSS